MAEKKETEEEKKKREAAEAKKKEEEEGSSEEGDDGEEEGEELTPEEEIKSLKADRDKWKALARKHEKKAKDNADKAKKFDELEAKGKTDSEKLTASEERTKKAERESLISRIALRKGLSETQAKRLVGETEEELEADADELLETFKSEESEEEESNGTGKRRQRLPKENLRVRSTKTGAAGSVKDAEPTKDDVKKIVDRSMESRY